MQTKSKSNPWFTSTLHAFKSTVRRAETVRTGFETKPEPDVARWDQVVTDGTCLHQWGRNSSRCGVKPPVN